MELESKRLQTKLQNERDAAERTKRAVHKMQSVVDNKELRLGPQATDEEVRAKFGSILASIKTWSTDFTGGGGEPGAFQENRLSQYLCVAPIHTTTSGLEHLVHDKKRRRLFVRGWAAYVMSDMLFRTLTAETHSGPQGDDYWLEPRASYSFCYLENKIYFAGKL
jgi:hypothetical protein